MKTPDQSKAEYWAANHCGDVRSCIKYGSGCQYCRKYIDSCSFQIAADTKPITLGAIFGNSSLGSV